MSGLSGVVVRLAARSLPALVRARYREEWLADLAGAEEAGVTRSAIAIGALSTAITIDRLDPATLGMTLSRAFTTRLRAAAGFGLAAALLAIGSDAYAGFPTLGPLGAVVSVLVAVLAVGAVVATALALRIAVAARRVAAAILVLLGALALLAVVFSRVGLMLVVLAAVPGVAVLVALAVVLTGGRLASRRVRIVTGAAVPVGALAVAAVGLAHVFVWNPLAKLPGMTLAEIYAGLAAAGEGPAGGPGPWIGAVAVLVALGAAVYATFALAPVRRWSRFRTRRRLVALGLLLIGGVVALVFVPAFTMGMGIADAYATSGGDAAGSGGVLALIGMLAFAGTILVSFVRVEPGPPEGAPARA
jgi:hypothetical protein